MRCLLLLKEEFTSDSTLGASDSSARFVRWGWPMRDHEVVESARINFDRGSVHFAWGGTLTSAADEVCVFEACR